MSIRPEELRVNNWLKDYYGISRQVAYVGETIGLHNDIGGTDRYQNKPIFSNDLKDLHPIPLTPEILIKVGFRFEKEATKEPHPVQKAMGIKPHVDCAYLAPCEDASFGMFDKMMLSATEDGEFEKSFCINSNPYDGYDIPCQYLHQLQNIWFILTGQELNYTP